MRTPFRALIVDKSGTYERQKLKRGAESAPYPGLSRTLGRIAVGANLFAISKPRNRPTSRTSKSTRPTSKRVRSQQPSHASLTPIDDFQRNNRITPRTHFASRPHQLNDITAPKKPSNHGKFSSLGTIPNCRDFGSSQQGRRKTSGFRGLTSKTVSLTSKRVLDVKLAPV